MTLQRVQGGTPLVYPATILSNARVYATGTTGGYSSFTTAGIIDAASEKVALVGNMFWAGGAASKTMNSASKIYFLTGTVTMANASTTVRIGLQDINAAAGPPIQPDGTFDVYKEFAGNAGIISSSDDNVIKNVTLDTSGSKTVANGDLIAVVFEMTAKGGGDSLAIAAMPGYSPAYHSLPAAVQYTTSWQNIGGSGVIPMVLLESSDGTFGTLLGCGLFASGSAYTYASASTPDERALKFQVPFKCNVNSAYVATGGNAATADGEIVLYSTPSGTPAVMGSAITVLGEYFANQTDERVHTFMFASDIQLEPNTDYALAYKATGAGSVNLGFITMSNAAHRSINGFDGCSGVSRSDGTGAFGSESTTDIPLMSIGICALDDGAGGGGGISQPYVMLNAGNRSMSY